MDTEGIGGIDEEADHDTKIFLLGLLLSSFMIYNSVGPIDENALQNLSLICNLSKNLKIKEHTSEIKQEDINRIFPSFLWVLRDFHLKLVDEYGKNITSRQYLENSLKPVTGFTDNVQQKNRIRKLLQSFFMDRDCFTLSRPSEDESQLYNLENIENNDLPYEFINGLEILKSKIKCRVKHKFINNNKINGEMLLNLAKS